jgi:hypothetical protein
MATTGKRAPIILGGKPVGENDWYIEELEELKKHVNGKGETVWADVSLLIKEYPT